MNDENLRPFNTLTESEQREIARQGGLASAESRRKRIAMRDAADMVLNLPVNLTADDLVNCQMYGIDMDEMTVMVKGLLAIADKAIKGNLRAFTFLRDTSGQKPSDKTSVTQRYVGDFDIVLDGDEPSETVIRYGYEPDEGIE